MTATARAAVPPSPTLTQGRVIEGRLFRFQDGRDKAFATARPKPLPVGRPLRVARTLALGHKLQQLLDDGVADTHAELAERLGFTASRVSQLIELTLLAPDIQEAVLFMESRGGRDAVVERELLRVARARGWREQRALLAEVTGGRLGE